MAFKKARLIWIETWKAQLRGDGTNMEEQEELTFLGLLFHLPMDILGTRALEKTCRSQVIFAQCCPQNFVSSPKGERSHVIA